MQVTSTGSGHIQKCVPCNPSNSYDNSCMLYGSIGIIQLCPGDPHFSSLAVPQHFFHPAGIDHFHIIIQKQQIFPGSIRFSKIIDSGIIKPCLPGNHLHILSLLQFLIIGKSLLFLTVVFYNNDLVIGIRCLFKHRIQTFFQSFLLIFIGNQDGNQRIPLYRVCHLIKSQIFRVADNPLHTRPGKISLDGTFSRIKSIHLTGRIIRRRGFMSAPVVQDFRDMADHLCLFHTPENKVIVLRAVILSAKTTRLPNQRRPRHKKMGNIVIGPQKIQIKIRFKMGLKMLGKVCRYLIFIRINHIHQRIFFPLQMLVHHFHHPIERLRRQKIVMIQKPQKFSLCHGECFIGIFRDSQIFLQFFHFDPGIFSCILF